MLTVSHSILQYTIVVKKKTKKKTKEIQTLSSGFLETWLTSDQCGWQVRCFLRNFAGKSALERQKSWTAPRGVWTTPGKWDAAAKAKLRHRKPTGLREERVCTYSLHRYPILSCHECKRSIVWHSMTMYDYVWLAWWSHADGPRISSTNLQSSSGVSTAWLWAVDGTGRCTENCLVHLHHLSGSIGAPGIRCVIERYGKIPSGNLT